MATDTAREIITTELQEIDEEPHRYPGVFDSIDRYGIMADAILNALDAEGLRITAITPLDAITTARNLAIQYSRSTSDPNHTAIYAEVARMIDRAGKHLILNVYDDQGSPHIEE